MVQLKEEIKKDVERLKKTIARERKTKLKGKRFLKKGKRPTLVINVPKIERSEPKPFFRREIEESRRLFFRF